MEFGGPTGPVANVNMACVACMDGIHIGVLDSLVRQHGQVLRHDVTEIGAEHADVKAAPVAQRSTVLGVNG